MPTELRNRPPPSDNFRTAPTPADTLVYTLLTCTYVDPLLLGTLYESTYSGGLVTSELQVPARHGGSDLSSLSSLGFEVGHRKSLRSKVLV